MGLFNNTNLKNKLHTPNLSISQNLKKVLRAVVIFALVLPALTYVAADYFNTKKELASIKDKLNSFESNLDQELFADHLKITEGMVLTSTLTDLQSEIEKLTQDKTLTSETNTKVNSIYTAYNTYLSNVARNKKDKLDTKEAEDKANGWGVLLLNKSFDQLAAEITEQNKALEDSYQKYLASLPPPTPQVSSGDYSYTTVSTERGSFGVHLIKVPISSVKVVTAAANSDNCKDNCPTKSLAQHVSDNGGYAGMNGSYFCPPDYSDCGGKVNSFDFALYKSSSGKWLNSKALGWSDTGLATFKGGSAKFYKKSTDYDGDGVTAGISNYPILLKDGNIVIDSDKLTSYQKNVKGTRGAIGVGSTNLYLALIYNATVSDAAYAMRALGAKDALNLDGGGSSAMYINGGYVVGPGRSLPNAIVLVK
uniref:Phosphodiester glycosidase domain-containing protein n=1 Tax=candidate division WWE3 bacterium TaxID=2053526 RepID=A0A7C4XNL6_UNCKA